MNRISTYFANNSAYSPKSLDRQSRESRRLRAESDFILRDVAYVLSLTRRVKAEILQDDQAIETMLASCK